MIAPAAPLPLPTQPPLRVAVVMLGGKRGGIEQALVDYCLALRHAGHRADAFIRAGAAIAPALKEEGISAFPLAQPHRWNLLLRGRLGRALRGYDAVILHGNRAGSLTRGCTLPPTIAVAHSRFFTPLPHFDAIIALSDARAEALRANTTTPLFRIPNLVAFPETCTRPPLHTPPVIGTMGRFSEEKGLDLLIDALALVRAEFGPVQLIIGGDGALAPKLKAYAATRGVADAIRWDGWVQDKAAFFSQLDIFCLSSRTETFPLAMMEAMAHGCPMVATRCGGPSEIMTDDCGTLTDISARAIADGILRLLRQPEQLAAMGEQSRARIASHYTLPIIAAQLDAMLAQVIATRNAEAA